MAVDAGNSRCFHSHCVLFCEQQLIQLKHTQNCSNDTCCCEKRDAASDAQRLEHVCVFTHKAIIATALNQVHGLETVVAAADLHIMLGEVADEVSIVCVCVCINVRLHCVHSKFGKG